MLAVMTRWEAVGTLHVTRRFCFVLVPAPHLVLGGGGGPPDHLGHQEKQGPQAAEEDDGDEEAPGCLDVVDFGGPGDGQADGQEQEKLRREEGRKHKVSPKSTDPVHLYSLCS